MKENLVAALASALCLACCHCIADDGSARRYAEFAEQGDLFRAFCLLEREDVQREIRMTAEQVAKVRQIYNTPAREIPGFVELAASYRKRRSDPTLAGADQVKLTEAENADVSRCIRRYERKELSAALSAPQRERLGELLIQMRGPIGITEDVAIQSKLALGEEQLKALRQVVKDYDVELGLLQSRYGRQQVSGLRYPNATYEDREKELEALFFVIREIERERDNAVVEKLSSRQADAWTAVQGKPFPIAWPRSAVFEVPFSGKKEREGKDK